MLSIIIPTLNEEKHLPLLFESIKSQNFKGLEIIVADAGSVDKTVEIADNFGCKIIKGGLPARGKNRGAKAAKSDLLLFLDADLNLPKDFFKKALREFKKRKLDIASFCLHPRTRKKIVKLGFNLFYNRPIVFTQKFLAHGSAAILVKKNIFEKVGGFDEKIKLAEDHYFVRQAAKIGKYGIIKSPGVFIHLRRFETDGYLSTLLKYLLCQIYMFSGKPLKNDIIKYKFNHYSEKAKRTETKKESKVFLTARKKINKIKK